MNLANWLYARALQSPELPALFQGAKCVGNYLSFARQSIAVAQCLQQEYGVTVGDRVAIYMANRIEYLPLLYAVWWLGGVVVPVNAKLHPKEAAWIVEHSQARVALTDSGEVWGDQALEVIELGSAVWGLALQEHCDLLEPYSVDSEQLAWLFYTSGTTGQPKGAMLSHGNLLAMSMAYPLDVDQVYEGDAKLYAAPLSHGAGLYNFIFVRAGARHVVPESRGFDSAEIFQLAEQLGSVCMFAAPTMIKRMVRGAPEGVVGLRTIICGGAPMYAADMDEALHTLGPCLAQIYGQGESPMTITAMSRSELSQPVTGTEHRRASVGRAHSCVEVEIVDELDRKLAAGQHGEVLVRGPVVMSGYWRDPAASAAALRGGWLRTGDIGFLSAEGYLTLTDRSKDVVISGGSNIYPREVEEVLLQHPAISEVAVIGVPDDEWGETILAFLVKKASQQVSVEQLEQWCKAQMAAYKRPKKYLFCDELPKNSYGKVLKTELRKWSVT